MDLNILKPSELDESQSRLIGSCDRIANDIRLGIKVTKESDWAHLIEEGEYAEGDYLSAFDYLTDVLDIEYITDSLKGYKSAEVLVAFGGPNIWIDLRNKEVRGFWGCDRYTAYFGDSEFYRELDEYLEEYFNCL
ncbi:MAG: hypothetical protein GWO20_00845 [Candidatus Korarchaeota archaeon]|nr:hypothetical protein [Candidatus Korarchaeota archaeon]